jgi:hypothetical protein
MAQKKNESQKDPIAELLRDLLIVELAKANVPQLEIRKVVGCDIHRVSRIAKVLKKAKIQGPE